MVEMEWVAWAIVAMVLFSVSNVALKVLVGQPGIVANVSDAFLGDLKIAFGAGIGAAVVFGLLEFAVKGPLMNTGLLGFVAALSILGLACLLVALQAGKAATAVTVLSLSTVLVAVLSFVFLGERFSWREILAIVFAIASVALLAM